MPDHESASQRVADLIADQVQLNPVSVLGLATGGTPERTYAILSERVCSGALSLSQVTTFNLDEYVGLSAEHPQSYHAYMRRHLFDVTDVRLEKTHLPDGAAVEAGGHSGSRVCEAYECLVDEAGGIDWQLLGLGSNGHIGFNEPGSAGDSVTRIVELAEATIEANSRYFDSPDEVPRQAVTMGIGSIMNAKRIVLIATGAGKANAVQQAVGGPVTPDLPASFLQRHPDVTFILDEAAASELESSR
ncbi:glucosamine-6-phosphate deaminase [Rhodopirellula halodulae]|uniref:glucosamine-6-phosphate deaminase n=1 Tax=Rhodopirellula halodulae TaxID=2894198 RepID=UPI0028F45FB4|nr:glucosamine-6-phosphate deaminase [Rhodopirellula sp. JC737]